MRWPYSVRVKDRLRRHGLTAALDSIVGTSGFLLADLLRFGIHIDVLSLALSAVLLICLFALANYRFGLHRRMWRYANLSDAWAVACAVAATTLAFSLLDFVLQAQNRPYWLSTVPNGAMLAFLLLVLVKILPRLHDRRSALPSTAASTSAPSRVLIVGAGQTGMMLARDIQINHSARSQVIGFVDDDASKTYMHLNGMEVLGTRHDIPHLVKEWGVDLIAIAIPSSTRAQIEDLIQICQGTGARVQIVPSLSEMATQPHRAVQLRELDVADLLGREEVRLDVAACAHYIEDKVVLVTGAAGSIGSELCRQLIHLRPRLLVALDTNETGLFDLSADLRDLDPTVRVDLCIADITDEELMGRVFAQYRPNVVFHAAAYKHVPLLQDHPAQAVRANVLGTAILCRTAHNTGVERFVFISSDKAVAAANNLGYSKRIGELLMRAYAQESKTLFCAVRFGNVIGSRGSVVPTFERQIAQGGPVTVTHPEVTRFFMSIPEAACLVIEAAANAISGSIYMLDMGQPVSIVSLAEKMIRLRGLRPGVDIEITFTGLRPGEKMHEELTSDLEDTVPTGHTKIMGVIDPRPVSRPGMEAVVRALTLLARRATKDTVSAALQAVSQGRPFTVPELDEVPAMTINAASQPVSTGQIETAGQLAAGGLWPYTVKDGPDDIDKLDVAAQLLLDQMARRIMSPRTLSAAPLTYTASRGRAHEAALRGGTGQKDRDHRVLDFMLHQRKHHNATNGGDSTPHERASPVWRAGRSGESMPNAPPC